MVIEGGIIYTDLKGQALNKPVTIHGLHAQLMKNNQKQWVLFNFKDNNSLVVKPAMVAYGVYENNIWGFTGNKQVTVSPDDVLTMSNYGGGGGSGDMTVAAYGGSDPNTVRRADNALKLDGKTPNELSINMDLLWHNDSATSSFATQSIPISRMAGYKLFVVCCGYSKQYNTTGAGHANIILPQTAGFCTVSNGISEFYRQANTTPDGFYFGDATQTYPSGSAGKKNDNCIPINIYGIK